MCPHQLLWAVWHACRATLGFACRVPLLEDFCSSSSASIFRWIAEDVTSVCLICSWCWVLGGAVDGWVVDVLSNLPVMPRLAVPGRGRFLRVTHPRSHVDGKRTFSTAVKLPRTGAKAALLKAFTSSSFDAPKHLIAHQWREGPYPIERTRRSPSSATRTLPAALEVPDNGCLIELDMDFTTCR